MAEKNSLWKNIRANRGSGRKPTAEMLRQERKIKAKQYAEGSFVQNQTDQNPPINTPTYSGGTLPTFEVVAEAPQWLKYKNEYEKTNPKSSYVNKYLTPFARGLGNDEVNYPKRIDDEYNNKLYSSYTDKLLDDFSFEFTDKEQELVDKYSKTERDKQLYNFLKEKEKEKRKSTRDKWSEATGDITFDTLVDQVPDIAENFKNNPYVGKALKFPHLNKMKAAYQFLYEGRPLTAVSELIKIPKFSSVGTDALMNAAQENPTGYDSATLENKYLSPVRLGALKNNQIISDIGKEIVASGETKDSNWSNRHYNLPALIDAGENFSKKYGVSQNDFTEFIENYMVGRNKSYKQTLDAYEKYLQSQSNKKATGGYYPTQGPPKALFKGYAEGGYTNPYNQYQDDQYLNYANGGWDSIANTALPKEGATNAQAMGQFGALQKIEDAGYSTAYQLGNNMLSDKLGADKAAIINQSYNKYSNIPIFGKKIGIAATMADTIFGKTKSRLEDAEEKQQQQLLTASQPIINQSLKYSQGGNMSDNSLNLHNTMRYKRFAQGGTLEQQGINFITDDAGFHHQNANGGVPIGPDALAEGGEAKLQMADGGQYIVSGEVDGANTQLINGETMTQRLKKKLKPFMMGGLASNPKDKDILRRPFDSYSAESINQAKEESIQETEAVRMQRGGAVQYAAHGGKLTKDIEKIVMEEYAAAYGGMLPNKYKGKVNMPGSYAKGGIHINPKNKGKFTASAKAAGHTVQEHASAVLNNPNATPIQKKRANFARNAAKWKHADGGYVHNQMIQPMLATGGPIYGDPASDYVYAMGGMYGDPYYRGGQIDYTNDVYSSYAGGGPMVSDAPQAFRGPSAQNRGGMYLYPDGGMMPPEQQMQQAPQEQMQQQGGQDQMMQMVQQIAQAIMQGAQPEQVMQQLMQQLVQSGMPEEQAMQQAQQIIQVAMQEVPMQEGQQPQGQPMQEGQQMPPQQGMSTGGRLPKDILRARAEAHMSPEKAAAYVDKYAMGGKMYYRGGPDGPPYDLPGMADMSSSEYNSINSYLTNLNTPNFVDNQGNTSSILSRMSNKKPLNLTNWKTPLTQPNAGPYQPGISGTVSTAELGNFYDQFTNDDIAYSNYLSGALPQSGPLANNQLTEDDIITLNFQEENLQPGTLTNDLINTQSDKQLVGNVLSNFPTVDFKSNTVDVTPTVYPNEGLEYTPDKVNPTKVNPGGSEGMSAADWGTMIGQLAGPASQFFQKKPKPFQYKKANATTLDPTTAIILANQASREAQATSDYGIKQNAPTSGSYLANIRANALQFGKQRGAGAAGITQQYDINNAGILNQIEQYNTDIENKNIDAIQQDLANFQTQRTNALYNAGANAAGLRRDYKANEINEIIAKNLGTANFKYDPITETFKYPGPNGQIITVPAATVLGTNSTNLSTGEMQQKGTPQFQSNFDKKLNTAFRNSAKKP